MKNKIFLLFLGVLFSLNLISSSLSNFPIDDLEEFNNLSSENLTKLLQKEFDFPYYVPIEKCNSLKYKIGIKLIREFSFQFVFKNIDMDNFYFVFKENNCIIDIEARKGVLNKYDVSFILDYNGYENDIDYKPEINGLTFRGKLFKQTLKN